MSDAATPTKRDPGANVWARLLPVQALDERLQRIAHKLDHLPERAARDEIDGELAQLRGEIERAESARHDLQRAQRRIEDEVATIEAKVATEEAKLYDGSSSDPGHLQDLTREIESLRAKINGLEDDELELMEQVEPIDATLATLAEQRAALDERAAAANAALAVAEADLAGERDAVEAERAEHTASIDAEALETYDRARQRFGGTAVAALSGGVCGACHLKLSAMEIDRIRHLPDDAEIICEECGRYLVRS